MMTTWPSYYVLAEERLGSLEPGKLADFIVLNKDYFTVPLTEIPTVYPVMTVVGGNISVVRQEAASDLGLSAMGPQLQYSFDTEGGFGEIPAPTTAQAEPDAEYRGLFTVR